MSLLEWFEFLGVLSVFFHSFKRLQDSFGFFWDYLRIVGIVGDDYEDCWVLCVCLVFV